MMQLYVVCEGLTEVNFVQSLLIPLLERPSAEGVSVSAPNLRGYRPYKEIRKLVLALLRDSRTGLRVTTLIDLFNLPHDFPGLPESDAREDPLRRADFLEQRFAENIGDPRFWPHLQLHEFEALLLTDITRLATRYPSRKKDLMELHNRVQHFPTPEHVNRMTPPSRRILQAVPEYQKVVAGVDTAREIGLEAIRRSCHHFHRWMTRLETELK